MYVISGKRVLDRNTGNALEEDKQRFEYMQFSEDQSEINFGSFKKARRFTEIGDAEKFFDENKEAFDQVVETYGEFDPESISIRKVVFKEVKPLYEAGKKKFNEEIQRRKEYKRRMNSDK